MVWTRLWKSEFYAKYSYSDGKFQMSVTNLERIWSMKQSSSNLEEEIHRQLPQFSSTVVDKIFPRIVDLLKGSDPGNTININYTTNQLEIIVNGKLGDLGLAWKFKLDIDAESSKMIFGEFIVPLFELYQKCQKRISKLEEIVSAQQENIEMLQSVTKLYGGTQIEIPVTEKVPDLTAMAAESIHQETIDQALSFMRSNTMVSIDQLDTKRKSPPPVPPADSIDSDPKPPPEVKQCTDDVPIIKPAADKDRKSKKRKLFR
jgi:hypothetical protein